MCLQRVHLTLWPCVCLRDMCVCSVFILLSGRAFVYVTCVFAACSSCSLAVRLSTCHVCLQRVHLALWPCVRLRDMCVCSVFILLSGRASVYVTCVFAVCSSCSLVVRPSTLHVCLQCVHLALWPCVRLRCMCVCCVFILLSGRASVYVTCVLAVCSSCSLAGRPST